MSVWLIIPVRSLRDGKSRLAPLLGPVQRFELVEALLGHTLQQAAEFPGLDRTLVVSPCAEALARAAAYGAQPLEERPPGGLNNALNQAQLMVRGLRASRTLIVSSDLPYLSAADLRSLAESRATIALAPDRARKGTNGICLDTRIDFGFSFGEGSFERHLELARALGVSTQVVERDALAFDLDVPSDFAELARYPESGLRLSSAPA